MISLRYFEYIQHIPVHYLLKGVTLPVHTLFLQVGGLGDVVTSLSRAVQDLNHNVDIILPKYDCLKMNQVSLNILHYQVCYLFFIPLPHTTSATQEGFSLALTIATFLLQYFVAKNEI